MQEAADEGDHQDLEEHRVAEENDQRYREERRVPEPARLLVEDVQERAGGARAAWAGGVTRGTLAPPERSLGGASDTECERGI